MKNIFYLFLITSLPYLLTSCSKSNVTCVSCNAPIIRVTVIVNGDTTARLDESMNYFPFVGLTDSIAPGYQRIIDTLPNSFIQYTNCYPSNVYDSYYGQNPSFFNKYCKK